MTKEEALNMIPEEWLIGLAQVLEMGAKKHGLNSWLDKNNKSLEHKANNASMNRHQAEHYCGKVKDYESGLDPLLHLATRSLMKYSRRVRGIDE